MQIRRLVLGIYGTNSYIVWGNDPGKALLIDPADEAGRIQAALEERNLTPEAVLLTHGHYDHFLAVPGLQRSWPDLPVYCHPADCPDELEEYDAELGCRFPTATALQNRKPLEDGQVLCLAGFEIRVLAVPGHTPGSMAFLAEDVLFSGDTLFRGDIGRTDFAGGDMGAMRRSLKRLAGLEGDYRVLPGHDAATTLEQERRWNPYLRKDRK